MALKMKMPESVASGTNYLDKPGRYHCVILEADEAPVSKSGTPIDGFKLELSVLNEGPDKGKQYDLYLHHPKLNASEKAQAWALKKQAAAIIACGLATHEQLGQDVEVELQEAKARQVLIELEFETDQNGEDKTDDKGRKYLSLAFANIYHVDDPRAQSYPRNEKALTLIPQSLRRDPASFTSPGESNASTGTSQSIAAATATTADDDLGDL